MFEEKFVRNILKKNIDEGTRRFVIYPFGENGMKIKNTLMECFGIEPEMIVDNEYSKYNNKLISLDVMKKHFEKNMKVILTVEDMNLNRQLVQALEEFMPKECIINLLKIRNGNKREIRDQFSLDYFLPIESTNIVLKRNMNQEKIKVRILHTVYAFWNSVETICEEFRKDNKYEICIILGNHDEDYDKRKKQMIEKGYLFVDWDKYNAQEDKPDILIMSHLWDRTVLPGCRENTKLIVVAAMAVIRYGNSEKEFVNLVRIGFDRFYPDYYLFDSLVYNEMSNNSFFKGRIVEMGNAKFDGIYEACREKKYPVDWEKLKRKRTVLWAPDHGIITINGVNQIKDEVTFDLYAKKIFQYAYDNEEIGLIFRPHPAFVYEMISLGYWKNEDLLRIRKYCENSKNIIFDETESYNSAYSVADAILADALCGITCSALPTMKPIGVLYRNDKQICSFAKELVKNYYSVHSEKELITFLEMIKFGNDPMYEMRKKESDRCIKHFDGKNGLRIKMFIEDTYQKMM